MSGFWSLVFWISLEPGIWDLGFPFAKANGLSASRMKLPVHRLEPLLIYVCVNLRRRNISVPEHFLDDPQIGAVA
jgi:hypothetical protein